MTQYLQRESNKITLAMFWENHLLGKYNFEPPYQRRSVWSDEKKSFLIDTIFKNYPIPPIFLHQKIDDETGKTTYDVIDGKQRLNAIIEFINNEISAASEYENAVVDEVIAGKYFKELDDDKLSDYKKRFWRYIIPIEYIDTGDQQVIDNIFDRLNRNGEPLTGQELRNSSYYGTSLLNLVEKKAKEPFWKDTLRNLDSARMEEIEFLSELLFTMIQGSEIHSDQKEIDRLYELYAGDASINWAEKEAEFDLIAEYIESLHINFIEWRITGPSHLYGIWTFCMDCVKNNEDPIIIRSKLSEFYQQLRGRDYTNANVIQYKQSMSSRTKSKGQRERRTFALIQYVIEP